MNIIDTRRHIDVFAPEAFGDRRIDVIGAGATGSRVVLALAKLGLDNIHVWDYDVVEAHNIANQVYGKGDIGKTKVKALAEIVKAQTGCELKVHETKVDGTQEMGDVVFLLTDTMSSRKEIWNKGLRYKTKVKLMIETRMGSDTGRVYTINPTKPVQVKGWESTLYEDAVAEVSACGTSISVGPTAEFLSGLAVWQLMRWHAIETGSKKDDTVDHEIIFGLRPLYTVTRNF